jgi:hypothetical protein
MGPVRFQGFGGPGSRPRPASRGPLVGQLPRLLVVLRLVVGVVGLVYAVLPIKYGSSNTPGRR